MGFLVNSGYTDVNAIDLNIKSYNFLHKQLYLKFSKMKYPFLKRISRINLFKDSKQFQNDEERNKYKNKKQLLKRNTAVLKVKNIIDKYTEKHKEKVYSTFFNSIADGIINKNYDYIGFSVSDINQSELSIILTKILREKGYKGHICFGGPYNNAIKEEKIKADTTLFDYGIDTFMLGCGENPTKELFEYLEGKRDISTVSNIIYMDSNRNIHENEIKNVYINEHISPIYNGYDFYEYPMPETILPIRTSSGCYYGKCSFCIYNYLSKYKQRSVDDVINEIKEIIKKYNVNNFYFVDAALSPAFIDEFSNRIINEKIEIYYMTNLRFEECYTKEFLQKLYKSGLRQAMWGLESASPRILKLMRKGTDINIAKRILKDSFSNKIFNHLYFIYHFPSETIEDFELTYNFIKKNKKYIFTTAEHDFSLYRETDIYKNYENYQIDKNIIDEMGDKSYRYAYILSKSEDEKKNFEKILGKIKHTMHSKDKLYGTCNSEALFLINKYS